MALHPRPWNHNTRYHPAILRRIPNGAQTVLDVGCGDGTLAAALTQRDLMVTALDNNADQVAATARRAPSADVLLADFTGYQPDSGFDVVTSLASLHHLPFESTLVKMADLLNPGGRLIVLGVWTDNTTTPDLIRNFSGSAMNATCHALWGEDVMDAPQTMPTMTFRQVRREAPRRYPVSGSDVWCCGVISLSGINLARTNSAPDSRSLRRRSTGVIKGFSDYADESTLHAGPAPCESMSRLFRPSTQRRLVTPAVFLLGLCTHLGLRGHPLRQRCVPIGGRVLVDHRGSR